jgi:hypothetical protein
MIIIIILFKIMIMMVIISCGSHSLPLSSCFAAFAYCILKSRVKHCRMHITTDAAAEHLCTSQQQRSCHLPAAATRRIKNPEKQCEHWIGMWEAAAAAAAHLQRSAAAAAASPSSASQQAAAIKR